MAVLEHYSQNSKGEKSIIDNHSNQSVKFAVNIKENKDKLSTLYRLPNVHERPY